MRAEGVLFTTLLDANRLKQSSRALTADQIIHEVTWSLRFAFDVQTEGTDYVCR